MMARGQMSWWTSTGQSGEGPQIRWRVVSRLKRYATIVAIALTAFVAVFIALQLLTRLIDHVR